MRVRPEPDCWCLRKKEPACELLRHDAPRPSLAMLQLQPLSVRSGYRVRIARVRPRYCPGRFRLVATAAEPQRKATRCDLGCLRETSAAGVSSNHQAGCDERTRLACRETHARVYQAWRSTRFERSRVRIAKRRLHRSRTLRAAPNREPRRISLNWRTHIPTRDVRMSDQCRTRC